MSILAEKVFDVINELFHPNPYKRIWREHYVLYKNTKLFFDFYIKELNVLVEVQGQQHFKYVKFFHGEKQNFYKQKSRDNLKIQYIEENPQYTLVVINFDEDIDEQTIMAKLKEGLFGG